MAEPVTPADLAALDQAIAEANHTINTLVAVAAGRAATGSREEAMVVVAKGMDRMPAPLLAKLLAVAVVRLAEAEEKRRG